ncbi:hypothetical protein [Mycolicibacterium porcinum]|uniref:DUF4254 domain-containing protein n=1 Tax=Mycolicibacterium porcinum TaxID=39693 RepID=A0ABV3VMN9_9MYCO
MTNDDRILGISVEKLMEAVERAEAQWPDWGDYTPEQASKYATASDAFTQLTRVHAASRRAVQMCATLASHCRAVADQLDTNPTAHPRELGLLSELLRQVEIRIRDAVINDPSATHPGPWWELAENVYQHAVQVAERITMIIPSIDQTNGPATVAEIRLAARCRSLSQAASMVREAVRTVECPSPRGDELIRIADALESHVEELDPEGLLRFP